jgi:signal transduction histidine kinase
MPDLRKFQRRALELVFWGSIVLVLVPLISFYFFDKQFRHEVGKNDLSRNWKLVDSATSTNTLNLDLPQDFGRNPQLRGKPKWILERTVSVAAIKQLQSPVLVLGRIADADQAYLGNCKIGSTGFTNGGERQGWWWGAIRIYPIPTSCLSSQSGDNMTLRLEVTKWGAGASGVMGGPIGLGESEHISPLALAVELLRFGTLAVYGLLLIVGVGIYYAFVFLLVPARFYNGIFGLCAVSIGIYQLITSSIFYRYLQNTALLMKINFLSAAMTGVFLLWFLSARFRKLNSRIFQVLAIISVVFLAYGFSRTSLEDVYRVYEKWFAVFLLAYFVAYLNFVRNWWTSRSKDMWRYVVGFSAVIFACTHDIVVTSAGIDAPYLIPYGFVILFGAISLTLAKEYADAFLHVEEQVSERTQDLGRALNQLRSLEKMKERFFANVSHDFKSPVTIALGSIEEAKQVKSPGEGSRVASMLQPAERSLHHLLEMISELLDTVKAESGTLKMNWETAKPAELLRDWVQPYEVLCDRKGIQLDLDVSGCGELKVPLDVSKLRRVVDNLLSNAVKFTDRRSEPARRNHPTGIIAVALRTDDARFRIEISDSGMGIPEDEKGKIFDRYYQSSRTSLKDHGGSGIGLAFAKEMVDLHNGRLSVETSEWGGAKFIVALPLSQDVEVTGEHQAVPVLTDDVLKGSLDVAYPPEAPRKIDPTLPSVLAAEDNPEVAQIVIAALSSEYNVFFAPDGEKALSMIRARSFDCLVTDIVMPRMRGDELVSTIRADSKLSGLPIVVVSSHSEETLIATVLRAGANDYVTKPFRREILLARVRAQIEAKKTTEWLAQNEKVIELGFLANGMAHQINNGLASLTNQTAFQLDLTQQSLENVGDLSPETKEELAGKLKKSREAIERALKRIRDLTQSVQAYSSGSRERTLINAADSVDLALTLHADKIKKKAIQVRTDGLAGLHFTGYSNFHEVMVNLIGNAADTVKDDGSGVIEVAGRSLEKEKAVEISVVDNGMGIAAEHLPKLCRPFFTTKAPGAGTGMGLFVVRTILEGQHRGTLTISSEGEGKGARFVVRVPQEAPEAAFSTEITIHGVPVG